MQEKVYENILNFIEASELRDYLIKNQTQLSIEEYADIITHLPINLNKKEELLLQLKEVATNSQENKLIVDMLRHADRAVKKLFEFDRDKSLMVLTRIDSNEIKGLVDESISDIVPIISYESALDYIKTENEALFECDFEKASLFVPYWYWEIDVFDLKEGISELVYTYICSYAGDVLYYYSYTDYFDTEFRGGDINLPVPYQAGDILHINCQPFNFQKYCLVTLVGDNKDCCAVRCLYLQRCGFVGESALKHGDYSEYGTYANQYISPLFRAEVFDQELLDDHAFMKKVSEKLKKNPSIGEKIFSYFYKNEKCML